MKNSHHYPSIFIAALACPIAFAVFLVDTSTAEAAPGCDPGVDSVDWTIPNDGAVVPPQTPIKVVLTEGVGNVLVVTDDDDEEVDGQEMEIEMAHGLQVFPAAFLEFVPDAPLEAGEYTVDIDDGAYEFTFTVDDGLDSFDAPEAVDFEWFHASQNIGYEYGCGTTIDEIHSIAVEPLDDQPAYYELLLEYGGGDEGIQLLQPDAYDGQHRNYVLSDVECITLRAFAADGTAGATTEYCEPHKSVEYEIDADEEFGKSLHRIDWDNIEGDNGPGCGSCTVAPGSAPPVWMILLAAVALLRRRTLVEIDGAQIS